MGLFVSSLSGLPARRGKHPENEDVNLSVTGMFVSVERQGKNPPPPKRKIQSFITDCFDNSIPITFTFDFLQSNNFIDAFFVSSQTPHGFILTLPGFFIFKKQIITLFSR